MGNHDSFRETDVDPRIAIRIMSELAFEAGRAILDVYQNKALHLRLKDDRSPVTEADMAANRVIVSGLRDAFPWISAVSEESTHAATAAADTFFLIDPLDGTKEFLAGNDEFTVNIALIDGAAPVLGVIYPLPWMRCFSRRQAAAPNRAPGAQLSRIWCSPPHRPPRAVMSRSHLSKEQSGYLEENSIQSVRYMGSSLKGCLVARGEADVYFRAGDVMEWDIAAMHCILAEAGGTIRRRNGAEVTFGHPGHRVSGGFWATTKETIRKS